MVVGFLNNIKREIEGVERQYKEGMFLFPFLPTLHVTVNENKKEDKKENEPDYYINMVKPKNYAGPKPRIGALWLKKIEKKDSKKYGQTYLSGNIEAPMVQGGVIYISIFKADAPKEGEEPKKWNYEILWNPPRQKDDASIPYTDMYIPSNHEVIDDEPLDF